MLVLSTKNNAGEWFFDIHFRTREIMFASPPFQSSKDENKPKAFLFRVTNYL